jgi:hypothetical protein
MGNVLRRDLVQPERAPPFSLARNRLLTIRGIDYRKFKLFHLSIIWRAGISSLRPFRGVRLIDLPLW